MKKIILSISILVASFIFSSLKTQAQCYTEGTNAINAGIGIGFFVPYPGNGISPVLSGSFEHGLRRLGPGVLGIGGIISFQNYVYNSNLGIYGDSYREVYTTLDFGVRGTWHPDILVSDKYDVYGVAQVSLEYRGYSHRGTGIYANSSLYTNPYNSIAPWPALLVGGRYYFTKNLAAFSEVGFDISAIKVGLTFKFGGE